MTAERPLMGMITDLAGLIVGSLVCLSSSVAADLRSEIEAADKSLFAAVFDSCDPDEVGRRVTEDLEFFHDRWGPIANSRDEFVKIIRSSCERQAAGSDPKARCEPLPETIAVYPMKNYGALETGSHRFYQIRPGGEVLTGRAKYVHLWRQVDARWLLARVISYDHVEGEAASK